MRNEMYKIGGFEEYRSRIYGNFSKFKVQILLVTIRKTLLEKSFFKRQNLYKKT